MQVRELKGAGERKLEVSVVERGECSERNSRTGRDAAGERGVIVDIEFEEVEQGVWKRWNGAVDI